MWNGYYALDMALCAYFYTCPWQSLAANHCENATKIREAILLRENVVNSPQIHFESASNHCENATKTHSEYSQWDSV